MSHEYFRSGWVAVAVRRLASFLLITLAITSLAFAERISGKVVSVADGDTLTILHGGREVVVRLEGVDAPELGEPFSNAAKKFLSALTYGKMLSVDIKDEDRYGRSIGRVSIGDRDVSVALIQAGMAWHHTRFSSDQELADAEWIARAAGIGIWSLPNPAPPWERARVMRQERSLSAGREPSAASGIVYRGNRNSKVFHRPSCRYYNCKNCTAVFRSREAAVDAGYRPGGHCRP